MQDAPLSEQEIDWLEDFLIERVDDDVDTRDLDEGILCLSELDGLFTAVISGPVMLPPSAWLPQVWGDFEPEFESVEAFQRIMTLMMRHMNDLAARFMERPEEFEPMFLETAARGKTYLVVDEWCEGYMRGVTLAAEKWDLQNQDMKILIAPIAAFHGEQVISTHDRLTSEEIQNLQQAITPNVREIHAHWLARRAMQMPSPVSRPAPKIGRNDPCSCGSGKKYKKCCLH